MAEEHGLELTWQNGPYLVIDGTVIKGNHSPYHKYSDLLCHAYSFKEQPEACTNPHPRPVPPHKKGHHGLKVFLIILLVAICVVALYFLRKSYLQRSEG